MMRILSLLLLLAAAGASAGAVSEPSPARDGSSPSAPYVLAPGDIVDVTVNTHSDYSRVVTIQPDGRIYFPVAGEIVAAGLTVSQLAARLQQGLDAELVNPRVTVSLKELGRKLTRPVSLLGAVRSPGTFDLREKGTLTELLAAAGGPIPLADLSRITITRADRMRVLTVDLSRVTQTGRADGDVALEPGDLIIVPTGVVPTALVTGAVAKPGPYEVLANARVIDLLSQAGGATLRADLSRIRLTRGDQVSSLDLRSVLTGGAATDSGANPLVQPGDTISLPENDNQIYLLGEVTRPDAYPLGAGDRLFDLLTRAGGPTPQANASKTVLIRRGEDGQAKADRLDLTRMLTKGDMRSNMPLRPGDVVIIPSRRVKNSSPLGTVGSLLVPLTGVFTLFGK